MRQRLKTFVKDNFLFGKGEIEDNQHLFEAGIVDSFGFVELLSFIEKTFGVNFNRADIEIENFDTISHIVDSIEKKTKEK
ncbi:MAG: acyl carrier protein [Candidatus Omnitrophica bacterium]|nr:acyl carrier protein [Candidatus Omnitrophota bacterium]